MAASTAEPPARATSVAASAAARLGAATASLVMRRGHGRAQRRVAMTAEASPATITSTAVKRSSVSHCSRSVSTRP